MKESRLFKIVYYILDKGQATASELADKLEVSVRTIYRDIDALSEAGIPVYAEAGRNGGIYLMKDFVLDKAIFSDKERQEIIFSLQSLNATQSINNEDTLSKLCAVFNMGSENWLEVDFSRWGDKKFDNEKFELLKSAVLQRKCIKIQYASSYGEISKRIVQPLKLMYKSISWYLKAYCTEKKDYRLFKLSRIIDVEVLEERFHMRSFPESDENLAQPHNPVVLRFPREMAYRVYDEFDKTQVEQQENGDLIVSADMPEDAWLTGFLLSFGTQVDIIAPIYLKEIIAEQAKLIYEKNKS